MGGKESHPVPVAKLWSIRAGWWLECAKRVALWRTRISETAVAAVCINQLRAQSSLHTTCWGGRKLFVPCCFSLLNCHRLPHSSALGEWTLQPLLPPHSSSFSMGCLFPGTSLWLCPSTCILVELYKKVLHISAALWSILGPSIPHSSSQSWVQSLQSPLLFNSSNNSLNAPLKISFAVLPTKN